MKTWIVLALIALAAVSFDAVAGHASMTAKLNHEATPAIAGTTTLPDGTRLVIDIVCPTMYPHCKEFWGSQLSHAVVHNGTFISDPISFEYAPVPFDQYVINVTVYAQQDQGVISKLKDDGWDGQKPIAFHFNNGPAPQISEARAKQIILAEAGIDPRLVNVETFSPIEWSRSMGGATPWVPLGKTESRAFFYTFASRDFDTYINLKVATLGAGNDYIVMEFMQSRIDCREGTGYPAALSMPLTYSYNMHGIPASDDYQSPFRTEVPIAHGTVLAQAVIGTCDAVRAHHGTVNYASR